MKYLELGLYGPSAILEAKSLSQKIAGGGDGIMRYTCLSTSNTNTV